jgi:hypothetical protein
MWISKRAVNELRSELDRVSKAAEGLKDMNAELVERWKEDQESILAFGELKKVNLANKGRLKALDRLLEAAAIQGAKDPDKLVIVFHKVRQGLETMIMDTEGAS